MYFLLIGMIINSDYRHNFPLSTKKQKKNFEGAGHQCILIFLKAPEKGKVKTRLSTRLNSEIVLELYRCMCRDTIKTVESTGQTMRIYYHPPGAEEKMAAWLGADVTLRPQVGMDLGARMDNAFRETFSDGYTEVLLIGSDLPDLPGDFLTEAFTELNNRDAVLGPAADGGYYLIGFRSDTYLRDLFFNMPWGSPLVFGKTMEMLNRCGLRVYLLPVWRDIDTVEDLIDLTERHRKGSLKGTATLHYMKTKGIEKSRLLR